MTKTLSLFLLLMILTIYACTPLAVSTPVPLTATGTAVYDETPQLPAVSPTEVASSATRKLYTNSAFGLSFQYPASWFGPDEYISAETLRVSVGSDVVYPYGTDRTEQIYMTPNSYYIVVQYTRNNQNPYWNDTYQSLSGLQDGESLSGARGTIIRVRQLDLGRFTGFEYIATLSETAQTEPVYNREVILVDDQSDLLTISGSPNNVEVGNGADWRAVYRMIDEENLAFFHEIVESVVTE